MNLKYLAVYLNDHLAGATGGVELAKRAASSNEGSDYGAFLSELAHEIAEDRASLVRIMERLEVKEDRLKTTGAYIFEKVGRLKPNAQLTGYSPLSRVVAVGERRVPVAEDVADEDLDQLGIELRPGDAAQLGDRVGRGDRVAVRVAGGHHVVGVGD